MSFAADISGFIHKVERDHAKLTKKLALQIFNGVVARTPVLTGRARSGWRMTVDYPSDYVAPETGPYTVPNVNAIKIPPFSNVFITNNVPYAERLENGWSEKAPQGMVSVTLAAVGAGIGI